MKAKIDQSRNIELTILGRGCTGVQDNGQVNDRIEGLATSDTHTRGPLGKRYGAELGITNYTSDEVREIPNPRTQPRWLQDRL